MYDKYGFDEGWKHRLTGYDYNKRWFRLDRTNVYNQWWLYDQDGFDMDGHNANWFRYDGVHKDTWKIYNKDGYDINGLDDQWLDKYGNPPEKEFVIVYARCHTCCGTWFVNMQWFPVMCDRCGGWWRIKKSRIEIHI